MTLHEQFAEAIDRLRDAPSNNRDMILDALRDCHVLSGEIILQSGEKHKQQQADYDRLLERCFAELTAEGEQPAEDAPFNPICPKCGGCGERYAGEPESVCPVCKGEGEISPSLKVCPECYALLDVSGHYIHCSRGKPQAEDAPSVEPTDENDSWTLRDLLDITSEAIVSGHELSKPLVVEVDDVEYEFLNIICAKDRILLRGWSGKEGGVDHD